MPSKVGKAGKASDGDEARLAAALIDLVRAVDVSDYRNSRGQTLKENLAFLHAQKIADDFCVTHEDICKALDLHGYKVDLVARHLSTRH
jgi:hypothetical protein